MKIPQLGFGTWQLRGRLCTEMVATALELGYRHIDTAIDYENHRDIAPAIKDVPRGDLTLVSKITPAEAYASTMREGVEGILEELETPYLDVLLYHWPDRSIPFEETFDAMMRIQEEGLCRGIGVSNFTIRHCKDALKTGATLVTNQVEFHPYLYQRELLDWCHDQNIVLTAYSPLARGEVVRDPLLQRIGGHHGKSAAQVALRWAVQHGLIVIPKASSRKRIQENGEIFDFALSEEEMAEINGLHREHRLVEGSWTDFQYV